MQGFVFMSFILISLFNTRFHFHLISFHFSFFKILNFIQFHMWPSVVLTDIRIKMQTGMQKNMTKNSQANGSLRENLSVFWLHLLALISRRNVGMRGHLRKEIILHKYQYFRFMTKTGAHFELLNWLEKGAQGFWCWRIMILFILPSIRTVAKFRNMYNMKIRYWNHF